MRKALLALSVLTLIALSCVGKLGLNLSEDPAIKSLKAYDEVDVNKWGQTELSIAQGEAILLIPLYPKGFLYPVKGKIGDSPAFEALDVDNEQIYVAPSSGKLRIGLDQLPQTPVPVGLFIFKGPDLDSIIMDLAYVQSRNPEAGFVNLALALLLKKQGEALALDQRYEEALSTFDRSLSAFQKVDAKLYSATISRLYKQKSNLYKMRGDFQQFEMNINKSMEALMVASAYYEKLSESRYSFLRFLTAEERFILLTKSNFFKVQNLTTPDWMEYGPNISLAYTSLGSFYYEAGDLQISLKYFDRAIEAAKRLNNRRSRLYAQFQLAQRYHILGLYELAEKNYLEALKYCDLRRHFDNVNFQLAMLRLKMGRIKTVNEFLRAVPARSTFTIRYLTRIGLANIYIKEKQYQKAIQELEPLQFNGPYTTNTYVPLATVAQVGGSLMQSYAKVGRVADAHRTMAELESLLEKHGKPASVQFAYLNRKAEASRELGINPVEPLREAISCLEEIRPTAAASMEYEFWENRIYAYNNLIDELQRQNDFVQALEIAEKARSRRFLDYLGMKKLGVKSSGAAVMAQQADSIMDSLSLIEKDMVEAAQAAGIKVRNVYQEGTRYTKQLENYRSKLQGVAKTDTQFGVARNIIPVSPEEIQKKLTADTTILEYYLTDGALYTWVMDRNNLNLVKQDISASEMKDLVGAFRENLFSDLLNRGVTGIKKPGKEIPNAPQKLYDLLISPVKQHIRTNKLCIVPYGILNYLPFQGLHDGKNYLIEQYAISYIPSLSVLEFLAKGEQKENYRILALGNPDLKDRDLDLPATEKEVEAIKGIFPSTEIFKREKATKGAVKKRASQFDIIHFASHGEYVPENPLASCIRLAPENEDDGRLEANEIFDMDMKADLVVTSACQTSIGQIGKGDEVVGLTRAFLYAGASSVLGSLWSINDEATSVFMKEFYPNLKTMDKAKALQHAQIKMIRSKDYSSPFYWAAFNLTGSF